MTADLHRFARSEGATLSAVLLAAVALVVARWSGQADLVIGSPMVDRREADFEPMVGFFIDIAPLRLRLDPHAGFAEHVRRARDELLAALAHPEAAVDRIVAGFGLSGQVSRTPLVQMLFNMFNFPQPRLRLAGLASEPVPVAPPGSPFDLTVYGQERDDRLQVEVVYNPDLFDQARMESFVDAVVAQLRSGTADPGAAVGDTGPGPRVPVARRRGRMSTVVSMPPANPTEHAVAGIWCDVLGLAEVGVTESFFDVGGTSVAAVAVQHRLRALTGREIRVVDLFRFPTVRTLAAFLDGEGDAGAQQISQAALRGAARRARGRRAASDPSTNDAHRSTVDTEGVAR